MMLDFTQLGIKDLAYDIVHSKEFKGQFSDFDYEWAVLRSAGEIYSSSDGECFNRKYYKNFLERIEYATDIHPELLKEEDSTSVLDDGIVTATYYNVGSPQYFLCIRKPDRNLYLVKKNLMFKDYITLDYDKPGVKLIAEIVLHPEVLRRSAELVKREVEKMVNNQ